VPRMPSQRSASTSRARRTTAYALVLLGLLSLEVRCSGAPQNSLLPPAPRPVVAESSSKNVETTCGPRDEIFSDLRWIPVDARLVSRIRLRAAGLATAQENLAEFASASGAQRTSEFPIPVFASLEYRQLALTLPLLRTSLADAGYYPAELIRVIGPGGIRAWAWAGSCDLDRVKDRIFAAWDMDLRTIPEGSVGTSLGSGFPFDLLLLSGSRSLFVPPGTAAATSRWLATASDMSKGGQPSLGALIDEIAPEPIVSALRGHSLLQGASAAAGDELVMVARRENVELRLANEIIEIWHASKTHAQ